MSKECVLEDVSKEELQKLSSPQIRFQVFRNKYPVLYEHINNLYQDIDNWPEKLYLYTHDMSEPPICPCCKNKKTSFESFNNGYRKVCGLSCSCSNKEFRKQSGLTRTKNRLNPPSKEIEPPLTKEILKTKSITFLREDNFSKSHPILYHFINSLYPNINKWFEKLYLYTNDIKEPPICPVCNKNPRIFNSFPKGYMQTCSRLCSHHNKESHQRSVEKRRQTYLKRRNKDLVKILDDGKELRMCPHFEICNKCEEKQYIISPKSFDERRYNNREVCTKIRQECGTQKSFLEEKIRLFLMELHIPFHHNIWTLLKNNNGNSSELDFYFPEKHLAIEINGELYHNLDFKEEDYHIKKFQKCQEQGVELISLWGDWIINDFELIKELILDALNHNDKAKYKKIWFPDLDDSQWPNDLGWCNNTPPTNIITHFCKHGKFDCCDSGLTKIQVLLGS